MMIQTLLLVLVLTQLAWTQKDTSIQPDMDDLSAAPPDLPKVRDSSNNDEEPGDEAYDDQENHGRKLKPLSYKTNDKIHPAKLRQKDRSDGDLNKHKRKNKKNHKSSNQKKARKSKPHTKDKKQHFKKKMANNLHGDADPVIGAQAAAAPLLAEHATSPPSYISNPTRRPNHSQNTKRTRSDDEEPAAHQPVIGARAAAPPSPSSQGADYPKNKNPSDRNSDTFYQDKLLQLQMLNEVIDSATPQHPPTPPLLHNSYQRTDDSSHAGAYKTQHDNLGGAFNTHDSSNSDLASSLSNLSSDLSEISTKMEIRLTDMQSSLKERQDSLRQVSSLVTMMVYRTGYPSYPYGFGTLDDSYQSTDYSSHVGVGAYKAQHDNLGGGHNTHDSINRELASSLSNLSSDLSEISTKMERRLTAMQSSLKERQDSLRQVSSLVTMMVYPTRYPSYPYGGSY